LFILQRIIKSRANKKKRQGIAQRCGGGNIGALLVGYGSIQR
jgi:hypothetical protein